MIKTQAVDLGPVCKNCQEQVNIGGCSECSVQFQDRENIYCRTKSREDSDHVHVLCVD